MLQNALSLTICAFVYSYQESYTYRDPITEFLECLYVNFDFDGAQQKLRECETVKMGVLGQLADTRHKSQLADESLQSDHGCKFS